ncbi:MAG: hypothetical protein AB7S81_01075 [Bdellovibrionales bacterium]
MSDATDFIEGTYFQVNGGSPRSQKDRDRLSGIHDQILKLSAPEAEQIEAFFQSLDDEKTPDNTCHRPRFKKLAIIAKSGVFLRQPLFS